MLQETDKKKVTKSISDLGRRVTSADVSAKTGLPVLVTSQLLNQIASETGGNLAVSNKGDLVYSFSPGFSNTYLAQGLKRVLEKTAQRAYTIGFFVLRISFGVMLILSTMIVVVTFYILFFANSGGKRKGRAQTAVTPTFDIVDYIALRDLLFCFSSTPSKVKYDYRHPTVRRREKSNFLLDCFSFLFGDGNPNEGLDEKRWQLIATVIKQNNNVITAEQLAPYTGADPSNETAVLPTLVRFNGKPEVTETGNIVYTFPSLAVTTGNDQMEPAPPFLREFPWKFCEVEKSALTPIHIVAGVNFLGLWFLWSLLHAGNTSSTAALFDVLFAYGTLFLLVPLFRWITIGVLNKKIDKRNSMREQCAENLLSPSAELKKKIAESREYRMRDHLIGRNSIVYSTEKASLDQEDELSRKFTVMPGEIIDAKPEETFDASPTD